MKASETPGSGEGGGIAWQPRCAPHQDTERARRESLLGPVRTCRDAADRPSRWRCAGQRPRGDASAQVARQPCDRRKGDASQPAATSVMAMSKVLHLLAPRSSSSNRRCATARHGSSAVDCAQINGCLSSSWRGTSRWTAGASAWRRRPPACHATTVRTPSPATPGRLWTGRGRSYRAAVPAPAPWHLHPIKAVAVSGSSARCSASKSASGEGTHSPSTATRISVEASLDFTSSSPGSELAATDEVASR